MSILRADPPSFINGKGPSDGTFTDSIDDITSWVLNLDRCYVPIQGPPGTGKTWTGATSCMPSSKQTDVSASLQ